MGDPTKGDELLKIGEDAKVALFRDQFRDRLSDHNQHRARIDKVYPGLADNLDGSSWTHLIGDLLISLCAHSFSSPILVHLIKHHP